jgi:hypothetical protein
MRRIALVLALAGAALLAFGFWGTQTAAGQQRYGGMTDNIPLLASILGGLLVLGAASIDMLAEKRTRGGGGGHGPA